MAHPADRLYQKRWGVFNHYLAYVFKRQGLQWNDCIERFDVNRVADALHEMGAGYYFITVMQGWREMLAPNKTFDEIAGTRPGEACPKRDIIMELADALGKYGIDLYLYYTADGPLRDEEIGKRFDFTLEDKTVTEAHAQKWGAVLREYSVRYGDGVKGWWLDGCYEWNGWTGDAESSLLRYYYDAIKAGNPEAISSFNPGVFSDVKKWYAREEFTAGESNDFLWIPKERFIDGAQAHILAPLGIDPDPKGEWNRWAQRGARRDRDYMNRYIHQVNEAGGVVTVEIHVEPDGSFDPEQVAALRGI